MSAVPRALCLYRQNHRMVGIGRDLCGSSSPTPLPKQGHLQQAAQDPVQDDLEYLQRRRLHSLSGQPVPVLRHPQSKVLLQSSTPFFSSVPVYSARCLRAKLSHTVLSMILSSTRVFQSWPAPRGFPHCSVNPNANTLPRCLLLIQEQDSSAA